MKPRTVDHAGTQAYPSYDDYRTGRRSFLKRLAGGALAAAAVAAAGVPVLRAQEIEGDIKAVQLPGAPPAVNPSNKPKPRPEPKKKPVKVEPLTKEQVEKAEALVAKLGDDRFKVREKAGKELMEMGPAVLPVLEKYVDAKDPEVKQRVGNLIEALKSTHGQATSTPPVKPHRQVLGKMIVPAPPVRRP